MNVYWHERVKNVFLNIKNLLTFDVVDKIILFNNNSNFTINYPDKRVISINSNHNFGYRAAFIVSLLTYNDIYFLLDDDVSVDKGTLQNFKKRMVGEDICLGYHGKILGDSDKPYTDPHQVVTTNDPEIKSSKQSEQVDVLVGNGGLCFTRGCIMNMLNLEASIWNESYDETREMDLLLSMANKCYVVPSKEDEGLITLNEFGVGYHRGKDHYPRRDNIINLIRKEIE